MKTKIERLAVVFSVITTIVLVFNYGAFVNADERNEPYYSNDTYQQIIDELNEEYGTSVHFPSAEECEILDISFERITISPEEFERSLRADIEANMLANQEARVLADEITKSKIDEIGFGVCQNNVELPDRTTYSVTQTKTVSGATVHMSATVNDNNNFWSYGTISSVWTTWQAGVNSTPAFQAQTYTYTFRDTRRTCFVELNGYTINSQLIIIDSNAYRSVEFYAGSAV